MADGETMNRPAMTCMGVPSAYSRKKRTIAVDIRVNSQ